MPTPPKTYVKGRLQGAQIWPTVCPRWARPDGGWNDGLSHIVYPDSKWIDHQQLFGYYKVCFNPGDVKALTEFIPIAEVLRAAAP